MRHTMRVKGAAVKRARGARQFESAYSFRGLFKISRPALIPSEKGALLHRFGQPWRVFGLTKLGYALLLEQEERPSRSDIGAVFF